MNKSHPYAVYKTFTTLLPAQIARFNMRIFQKDLNLHLLEVVSYELASQQLTINVEVQCL